MFTTQRPFYDLNDAQVACDARRSSSPLPMPSFPSVSNNVGLESLPATVLDGDLPTLTPQLPELNAEEALEQWVESMLHDD